MLQLLEWPIEGVRQGTNLQDSNQNFDRFGVSGVKLKNLSEDLDKGSASASPTNPSPRNESLPASPRLDERDAERNSSIGLDEVSFARQKSGLTPVCSTLIILSYLPVQESLKSPIQRLNLNHTRCASKQQMSKCNCFEFKEKNITGGGY